MSIEDKLHRARAYPYDSPRFSYLYHDGEVKPFDVDLTAGRTPVLAFGSNKAPSQLTRKFGKFPDQLIPVEQVTLHNFDVVFAAHITSYGAMPAMLQHCPGVILKVAVTWLDDQQLDIMHKSELYTANYSFAQIDDIHLERAEHPSLSQIFAYIGERGHYSPTLDQVGAVSIASIEAENRLWRSSTTADLLGQLHKIINTEKDEEAFILRLIEDAPYRRAITQEISQHEHAFAYPYKILVSGDDLIHKS